LRLDRLDQEIGIYLREYPAAVRAAGVEVLLMGEMALAGPTVAEILRIPYFVVSTSIPHNFGWQAPPSFRALCLPQAARQARMFEVSIFRMKGPIRQILDRYRRDAALGSIARIGSTWPELAHITQWPSCFELPRHNLPPRFFYTGPFAARGPRRPVHFPWDKLRGQPLIYASLGTTRKADPAIYHRIAAACAGLDMQLVITLGGGRTLSPFASLPGNPLIVEDAPQLDLLERADVVITHAGPNTVLETLLQGKPMLALPLALDQPAVALRLKRVGAALVLSPSRSSAEDIRAALLKIKTERRYAEAARAVQIQLSSLRGTERAASIMESRLRTVTHSDMLPARSLECVD
jgi:zeaxanthin glucosyltransferase